MGGTRMTDSAVPDGTRSPASKVKSLPLEPTPDIQDSKPRQEPRYRRVVLKLSGEALAGDVGSGIDPAVVNAIADQVRDVVERGVQMAIVVGGGNIWRGIAASAQGMDRSTADYMGMLATVLNALALHDALEKRHV